MPNLGKDISENWFLKKLHKFKYCNQAAMSQRCGKNLSALAFRFSSSNLLRLSGFFISEPVPNLHIIKNQDFSV